MLLARSPSELRRLQYEVEQYLSTRQHDVDARLLKDDVIQALETTAFVRTVDGGLPSAVQPHAAMSQRARLVRYAVLAAFVLVGVGLAVTILSVQYCGR